MPARPAYFHRLTEALEVFRSSPAEWVDRRTLEEVLGISKTVAWRLLRQSGAVDGPGNTLVCRRVDLLAALTHLQDTGACQHELRRRERVEGQLEELRAFVQSRRIALAPASQAGELRNARFGKLPPGVDLSPSRLLIGFSSLEDFLPKIGAVVFALQNDFEAIQEFLKR